MAFGKKKTMGQEKEELMKKLEEIKEREEQPEEEQKIQQIQDGLNSLWAMTRFAMVFSIINTGLLLGLIGWILIA